MPLIDEIGAGTAILAGANVLSGYLGGKGAKDAANIGADASRYAADIQDQQYQQTRQDLAPYRDVATGTRGAYDDKSRQLREIAADFRFKERDSLAKYGLDKLTDEQLLDKLQSGQMGKGFNDRWGAQMAEVGQLRRDVEAMGDPSQLTGGALNELANYGRTAIDPNAYIPQNDIPEYQRSVIDMNSNIQGDIPQYDPNFDITKDPSYQFRLDEQNRQINRNMAGAGKVVSGNRLEEIMKRSGQMASQEYAAQDARNVRDYGIGRQNEAQQYGRDVGDYGRGYAQNVDQYGRDLTDYNAQTAREQQLYGRGVDAYGRAYSAEGDYLNRLAALSNVGQSAVNTGGQLGANAAANQGNAIQAAGGYQAAGAMGQANAWQGALGDLTSLATTAYQPSYNPNFNLNAPQGGALSNPGGGYQGSGMGVWDAYG